MSTQAMEERTKQLGGKWKDEGGGYFSLAAYRNVGFMAGQLAYIALPEGHPAVGKDYDDLSPEVNGGLTYASENVFGWDYLHAFNDGSPEEDIPAALEYFRNLAGAAAE